MFTFSIERNRLTMRFLSFVVLLALTSCGLSEPEITLLHPIAAYDGRLDIVKFEWIGTTKASRYLVLASDGNFEDVIVDLNRS